MIIFSKVRFLAARSTIFWSIVEAATRRNISTGFSWPILWQRSWAWISFCGFCVKWSLIVKNSTVSYSHRTEVNINTRNFAVSTKPTNPSFLSMNEPIRYRRLPQDTSRNWSNQHRNNQGNQSNYVSLMTMYHKGEAAQSARSVSIGNRFRVNYAFSIL